MAKIESRQFKTFSIPEDIQSYIEKILKSKNLSFEKTNQLAEMILRQSNYYIENPQKQTPWSETWSQVAQAIYYFPLNYLRVQAVIERGHGVNFFANLTNFIDYGAGLGSASRQLKNFLKSGVCIEQSKEARDLAKLEWVQNVSEIAPQSLGVFSYVLTELEELPTWASNCEALMIVEPGTHQDGRKLMEIRKKLIDSGFFIWAPCTHQMACPLLTQSNKDWCHDRLHWNMPKWFEKIEQKLPIKNKTLAFSYLLAKKSQPPKNENHMRVVGDVLDERGKSKVMICRGEKREFLSWLHRKPFEKAIYRGELLETPQFEVKGNELRV